MHNADKCFDFLTAVATRIPGITLANALGLYEDALRYVAESSIRTLYDTSTPAGLAAYARTKSEVMVELPDRKIQAIKALRQVAGVGLKEAKDACDLIMQESYGRTY